MFEVNSLRKTYQILLFFVDMKLVKSSLKVDFYFHNLKVSRKASSRRSLQTCKYINRYNSQL